MINKNEQIYNKKKFKPSPLISPVFGIIGEKKHYTQKNENISIYNKVQETNKNTENDVTAIVKNKTLKKEEFINNLKKQTKQDKKISNNKTAISERTLIITKKKIILPFTVKQIENIFNLHPDKYADLQQIVDIKFTLSTALYKNVTLSKIKEVYKLMRVRNKYSLHKTLSICIEVIFNIYIFPAIITACKNFDELEIYLDCLEKDELNQYPCFKIIYDL